MILVAHQDHVGRGFSGSVRQKELRRLVTALDSIDGNTGRVVELVGAPGSGKSRLLSALTQEISRRNVNNYSGRCVESEGDVRFHSFIHVLDSRQVLDSLEHLPVKSADVLRGALDGTVWRRGHALQPSQTGWAQFRNVVRLLLSHIAEQGLVLIFDDFHHADPDSVDLFDYLVRFPVPRLLLVVAHRNRQASARLRGAFAHGVELGTVERVQLGALSLTQAAQILDLPAHEPRLRSLHRQSEGNPAYLLMLAQGEPEALSESVEFAAELGTDMLLGELAVLGTEENTVMTAAAVIGDRFDLGALATVAELGLDRVKQAVAHLVRRDLLRPAGSPASYTFRHPVVRRLVCARTAPLRRLPAHRRALRVLLERNAPVESQAVHVDFLLDHLELHALPTLIRAADQAVSSEPSSAVRWLRAMLQALPDDEHRRADRIRLSLRLSCALMAAGQTTESRELYLRTLDRVTPCSPGLRTSAVILCAQLESMLGHHVEARRLLDAELARVPGGSIETVELTLGQHFVMSLHRKPGGPALTEQCIRLAQMHEDRVNEAGALAASAMERLIGGEVGRAGAAATSCASLVDTLSDAELADHVDYLAMLAGAECHLDRFEQAKRHITRGVSIARAFGVHYHVPMLLVGLSTVYHQVGLLEEATHAAAEAARLARGMGARHVLGLALARQSACALATEGHLDPHKAVSLAEDALALLSSDSFYRGIEAVLIFADAVLTAGDPLRCRALILDAGDGLDLPRVPPMQRARCFEKLTAIAVAVGDDAAERWAKEAYSAALATRLPSHVAFAMSAEAHVLTAVGDYAGALSRYRRAADLFSGARMSLAQARTLNLAAAGASRCCRCDEAATLLYLAKELARRCGARQEYERAKALQRQVDQMLKGEHAVSELSEVAELLTTRETEIARLAGKGERTKDIAELLSLSPRTVDVHLTNIYRKLGIKSRTELANRLFRAAGPSGF
ncbi:AAA family ATPase [Streptomyces sp. NPDC006617]|uniref:helix-turn-helix transcriptional regulator n=1 Tax=Streptomyces sp. NPDC006617 TaxID=3155354 RepID=UPI0033A0E3A1